MGNPDTPRDNKKGNSGPDTPPSAKSTSSHNTSSSHGTTAGGTGTSVFLDGGPLDTVEGSEGEEEEEKLPVEIKERVYSEGEKGELELLEDLKKHGLEDYDCHVDLDDEGRAHLRRPTDMHQMAVKAMEYRFTDGQSEPLCTDRDPNVRVTKGPKKKNPDLAVWGKERLNKFKVPKTVEIGGNELFKPRMNPHVIIEFSWTNKLKEKEIPKFNRQMKDYVEDLGQINLGFLIKAKAANGKELAKEEEAASVPLCGFDVYKAESGEQLTPGQPPFLKYRIGVNEDASITIPGGCLGEGEYKDIEIPLQFVCEVIADSGVTFAQEE